MKKSDIFWQTYLSLEKELINVSNFIFITDEITTHEHGKEITKPCNSQLETFSPYIADLLIPNSRIYDVFGRFASYLINFLLLNSGSLKIV